MQLRLVLAATTLTALVATSSAFGEDCKPANTFTTVQRGKLSVAIYEYPPFTSIATDGSIGGIDSDIAKAIAKRNCLAVEPVVVEAGAVIENVLSKKADIGIGDWYRTAKRAQVLGMSYPTYLDQAAIYSRAGLDTVKDLEGKSVGTVSGFLWVDQLQKVLGDKLVLYPTPVAVAQDLQAGRIEAAVDGYSSGAFAQSKGGFPGIQIKVMKPDERVGSSVAPAQATLLYSKDNPQLGEALDAALKDMHKSGELGNILKANGLDPSGAEVGEPRLIQ
jgi:polar amino acid transport system substrate-binding protein